jgi:UDP:flavonoid glycosyltransferase YjiC (YdhE family)
MSLATTLQDKVLILGEADEQFPLADLLRKNYEVVTTCPETGETNSRAFNNSAEANAYAAATGGEVVVTEVTDTPKNAFWTLWKQFKKTMQSQGVYVTQRAGNFVVTDTKPTRREVMRSKGYGHSEYVAPEWDKHEMIDRDEDALQDA